MTRRLTKVSAVVLSAILSARDATRHMNCVDVSTSNCDARNFYSKTHDHVNHLGLGMSATMQRRKAHD